MTADLLEMTAGLLEIIFRNLGGAVGDLILNGKRIKITIRQIVSKSPPVTSKRPPVTSKRSATISKSPVSSSNGRLLEIGGGSLKVSARALTVDF